jgi:hypothetical protein
MNRGGFAIIRGGILDHLVSGKIGFFELGLYATIHLQADFKTGVWWGSSPKLLAAAPSGTSLRDVQRGLQTLVEIGFLRTFRIHGARGNYPVLIDKYDVRTGALSGTRLNAAKSESWRKPLYESCAEAVAEAAPSSVFSIKKKSFKTKKSPASQGSTNPQFKTSVMSIPGNELSEEGARKIAAYGVVS